MLVVVVLRAVGDSGRDPLSGCCRCWGAQQVVSELPGFDWDFLKIQRARDLIRWKSCVDLRSEVLVFEGSCVDLRRTQGVLVESLLE